MKNPTSCLRAGSALGILFMAGLLVGCDGGSTKVHEGHDDHGPPGASGDEVSLSAEQVQAAGIRTAVVGSGTVSQRLRLTAVVQENLDAQAHLTPKVPGLVRSVRKQLGDRVSKGEVLCELESTVLGEATSVYMEGRATLAATKERLKQEAAMLGKSVQLAEQIFARESRLKEQAITTMRPFYEAEKALAVARLDKDRRLMELRAELKQQEIKLHTAEERLRILGLSAEDLRKLDADEEHGHGRYPLRAPRSGIVVARDLTENEYVDTSSKLFLIQDLSRVWVIASVYEGDLARVRRGQTALVKLEAFQGVTLRGQVRLLDYRVDPTSRACKVRIELPNEPVPGWEEAFPLRPGMFGTVELVVSEKQAAITVPEEAIVHEGERNYVFVALDAEEKGDHGEKGHDDHGDKSHDDHGDKGHDDHGDKGHDDHDDKSHDDHDDKGHDDHDDKGQATGPRQRFVRRAVEIGARGQASVEITKGLKVGEQVVVAGTFTLKSTARQGELGGGHSH
tara:strand:- start:1800 stop:3326 length:1527 start_codon:yes stop_codon:yes gene_type:complete